MMRSLESQGTVHSYECAAQMMLVGRQDFRIRNILKRILVRRIKKDADAHRRGGGKIHHARNELAGTQHDLIRRFQQKFPLPWSDGDCFRLLRTGKKHFLQCFSNLEVIFARLGHRTARDAHHRFPVAHRLQDNGDLVRLFRVVQMVIEDARVVLYDVGIKDSRLLDILRAVRKEQRAVPVCDFHFQPLHRLRLRDMQSRRCLSRLRWQRLFSLQAFSRGAQIFRQKPLARVRRLPCSLRCRVLCRPHAFAFDAFRFLRFFRHPLFLAPHSFLGCTIRFLRLRDFFDDALRFLRLLDFFDDALRFLFRLFFFLGYVRFRLCFVPDILPANQLVVFAVFVIQDFHFVLALLFLRDSSLLGSPSSRLRLRSDPRLILRFAPPFLFLPLDTLGIFLSLMARRYDGSRAENSERRQRRSDCLSFHPVRPPAVFSPSSLQHFAKAREMPRLSPSIAAGEIP